MPRTKPERSAVSDTVSRVKGARVGRLVARGLVGAATAVIVVVAALLTWPWAAAGPSVDERRIEDLQRLSHAINAFRLRQHVLPASLTRLPSEPAAPIHIYDPVTNRPYDYRPLGPLAYELCAGFDAASPEERRGFWWHDAGRHCFALETREGPKPPAGPARPLPASSAHPSQPGRAPSSEPSPEPNPEPSPEPSPGSSRGPSPEPSPERGPDPGRQQRPRPGSEPAPQGDSEPKPPPPAAEPGARRCPDCRPPGVSAPQARGVPCCSRTRCACRPETTRGR